MPLFLKNKIVFIHIPKTGGSSIQHVLNTTGDIAVFYCGQAKLNNVPPQHMPLSALYELNLVPDDFRIITVIRHPYERVISAYNYLQASRIYAEGKDINNLQDFITQFFSDQTWSGHNRSCFSLLNVNGAIPEKVEIIEFHNLGKEFNEKTGLIARHDIKNKRCATLDDLTPSMKNIIQDKWREDFEYFKYLK